MKKSILRKIHRLINEESTLDEQLYVAILVAGAIISFSAIFIGYTLGMGTTAESVALACCVWFMAFYLDLTDNGMIQRHVIFFVCGLNFILLPSVFLTFGGAFSGIPLFFMLGLFNVGVLIKDQLKMILISVASLAIMLASFWFAHYHIGTQLLVTIALIYKNEAISFLLAGAVFAILNAYVIREYDNEKKKNAELIDKFQKMSSHDPLTNLFNRRELFRRLDIVYKPHQEEVSRNKLVRKNCYLAMFDIDNFKHLNDTYSHQFGDVVLAAVAEKISSSVIPSKAETGARYGGEEFMCILYEKNLEAAKARADKIRQSVSELTFEDEPDVRITVSGGVVSCEEYETLRDAVSIVDALLYQSKRLGKNQISSQLDDISLEEVRLGAHHKV